ncbi:hypothetical protein SAMN05720606_10180 [Paenibacillus polysaccharolyticus]|uniref:Uncharacterized protein n=1 Tax=Paenibacillus polysaccharolyticus TaxID=582692 RepID=A0A1G5AS70_9BACL|nr:hypothetical protein [Paenibacillus polysaccharolyticus]SCX80701.1 hypothetical protein SAMN05720606_10180 [Paenibacillus polysaccharolyticus]
MNIVSEINYDYISERFPSSFIDDLDELEPKKKIIKIFTKYPSLVLLDGLKILKRYEETFSLDIIYDGNYDKDKDRTTDFKLSSTLDKKDLDKFMYIFTASIDEYGFSNVHDSEEDYTTQINDSSLNLEIKQKNIRFSPPNIKLSGKLIGSYHDISISNQYECKANIVITGLSNKDVCTHQDWKIKMLLAFNDYREKNYDGMLKNIHTCFELFLKTQIQGKLDFHKRWSKAMVTSKLTKEDLLMKSSEWEKVENKSSSDEIYRKQIDKYLTIKKKRNANSHEKHISITKKEAQNFAYICITFIYSILLQENKFVEPWIQGI